MQFNESYNKEVFKEFLTDFLPDDLDLSEKELVISANYREIKSGIILGESKSLDLKIIQLVHKKERDPRVALAKEAFKIMAENWAKKALVVFSSENSDNWRLSFMTISFDINEKNKVVSNLSSPKRKSFFLGPDSKTSTPNSFLIKKGRVKNFEDLESRFDVEVVTKEFFDNYKKLFVKFSEHLREDRAFNAFAGNNKIKLEDFAKKLLGQIVFVYFLQRKGWLGAKKESHIYEGDHNFLRSLYQTCEAKNESFFNNYLEHLFYNAFNKEPEKAGNFYREYFDCQIPFLNGGLFEPLNGYNWENSFLQIPNELFSNKEKTGILDIFDLYNFTIDENSLIDQEVSVDPEMLGKVFEKLLDTNKETGSFYTPREIVSYMVKQSLIEHLKTKTDISENDIEELINDHKISDPILSKKDFEAIENALKDIKIIDPAVGSGAFPVGLLQEITTVRQICQSKFLNKPRLAYDIKKEILENNIYGIDIDHGAIDIARLRFWLSLVVDADLNDVEPLPNLDFKLVAANSLLKLDHEEGVYDENNLLEKMKDLREKYFRARTKNSKESIQNDFKKLVRKSDNMLATKRQKQITTYDPFSPSSVAQFFDPEFMFGVNEFDLVIGNPPYGAKLTKDERSYYLKNYKTSFFKVDTYGLFIEFGMKILFQDGILAFIVPYTWLTINQYKKLRILLSENNLMHIVNLPTKIFEGSDLDTVVFIVQKDNKDNDLLNIYNINKDKCILKYRELSKKLVFNSEEKIIKLNVSNEDLEIIKKIDKNKSAHEQGFEVCQGLIPYSKDKLIKMFGCEQGEKILKGRLWHIEDIDNKNKEFKKELRGEDINRYDLKWSGLKIKYGKWLAAPRDQKFFVRPRVLVREITRGEDYKIKAVYADEEFYNSPVIINIIHNKDNKLLLQLYTAILNSKLATYYHLKVHSKAQANTSIPKILIQDLRFFPVVEVTEKNIRIVNLISDLTSKIINIDNKGDKISLSSLNIEIDKLVYELYGLTDEEVKIVKGT